jgi:hypothetical protein
MVDGRIEQDQGKIVKIINERSARHKPKLELTAES